MEELMVDVKEDKAIFRASLLRQIVDEIDSLNIEEQQNLLSRLRLEKLETRFKAFDEKLKANEIKLTEEDIAELVSNERKKGISA